MTEPRFLGIVGLSNSGKTTLVRRLTAHWTAQGLRVGLIKHDGHADAALPAPWQATGSDTAEALASGASATLVAGGGQTLLHRRFDPNAQDVFTLARRLAAEEADSGQALDIILVEGFKSSNLPKLVLARTPEQVAWIHRTPLQAVVGVVLSGEVVTLADPAWQVYHEDDIVGIGTEIIT